jgi:hypothetical protein
MVASMAQRLKSDGCGGRIFYRQGKWRICGAQAAQLCYSFCAAVSAVLLVCQGCTDRIRHSARPGKNLGKIQAQSSARHWNDGAAMLASAPKPLRCPIPGCRFCRRWCENQLRRNIIRFRGPQTS